MHSFFAIPGALLFENFHADAIADFPIEQGETGIDRVGNGLPGSEDEFADILQSRHDRGGAPDGGGERARLGRGLGHGWG